MLGLICIAHGRSNDHYAQLLLIMSSSVTFIQSYLMRIATLVMVMVACSISTIIIIQWNNFIHFSTVLELCLEESLHWVEWLLEAAVPSRLECQHLQAPTAKLKAKIVDHCSLKKRLAWGGVFWAPTKLFSNLVLRMMVVYNNLYIHVHVRYIIKIYV